VRIYDTVSKQRITFITPPQPDIRADLYRCSLFWRDTHSLLIAWGDHIKIVKVKVKGGKPASSSTSSSAAPGLTSSPQLYVEVEAIYQLDSNISGILPYGKDFLTLVYIVDDQQDSDGDEEETDRRFRRQAALPPELRIITSEGEEHSSDALSISNFARYSCNDYSLIPSADSPGDIEPEQRIFYVLTPTDIVVARQRTRKDHIDWLIEKQHYAQVLSEIEALGSKDAKILGYDSADIGRKYLQHLVETGKFERAAKMTARILGRDAKAWEDWIFLFVERGQLRAIIPHIPIEDPTLSEIIYDMVLAHFLQTDSDQLIETIESWPPHIYSTQAVVRAIEDKLKKEPSSSILLESLAAIFVANRQPGKALPYYLRLRKPHVFDLIREHNLFSDVRDQALSLVEFDEAISEGNEEQEFGSSIHLLVDHTFSIPVTRVVPQLEQNARYLHYYLDALFRRDSQSVVPYADKQVQLYAEYEPHKLMGFLRTMSSYYKFEEVGNFSSTACIVH
jgi:vacuolar protein sorting-associated protein 41